MENVGENIKTLRKLKFLSVEKLAQMANVKSDTLRKIENLDTKKPRPHTIDKIAEVLEVTSEELMSPIFSVPGNNGTKNDFIRTLNLDANLSSIKSEGIYEELKSGLTGKRIGSNIVQWVYDQVDTLSELDDVIGSKELYPVVQSNFYLVKNLLKKSTFNSDTEKELRTGLAYTARLLAWLAQDAGDIINSQRNYRLAIDMARSVGNRDFASYCIAMLAFQAVDNGYPDQCLTLLECAEAEAEKDSPIHIVLAQWVVQPLGLLGHHKAAVQGLIRADTLWDKRDVDRIPNWLYWMLRPSLTSEVPRGFIQYDPSFSLELLHKGIKALSDDFPRDKILFLMGIAEAHKTKGTLDEALATATEVMQLSSKISIPRVEERLQQFFKQLPNDQITKNFRDQNYQRYN